MSVADFEKFGQLIAEKPDVREKAKKIGVNDVQGQIAYAKTLGLNFTEADMAAAMKKSGLASKELSDSDLEKVAGGCFSTVAAVAAVVAAGAAVASVGANVGATASRDW